MLKCMAMLCSVASLAMFNLSGVSVFAQEKENSKPGATLRMKTEEMKLEGKVLKTDKGFFLKTTDEEIKLPISKDKETKIKLEDFVDKTVKITAQGILIKPGQNGAGSSSNNDNNQAKEKHYLSSISEITVTDVSENKKDEPTK